MKPLVLEILPGNHYSYACNQAMKIAHEKDTVVEFDFNGHKITVDKSSTLVELSDRYARLCQEAREKYEASGEGKKYEAKRKKDIATKQKIVDGLTTSLLSFNETDVAKRDGYVLKMLSELAEPADDMDVKTEFGSIVEKLKSLGYKDSDCVKLEKSEYENQPILARYIVGQCISCMRKGMAPHHVVTRFVDDYFKLQ